MGKSVRGGGECAKRSSCALATQKLFLCNWECRIIPVVCKSVCICGTIRRFQYGLGMTLVAKSDQSTGNEVFASYALKSGDLVFAFTAPYSRKVMGLSPLAVPPRPTLTPAARLAMLQGHEGAEEQHGDPAPEL